MDDERLDSLSESAQVDLLIFIIALLVAETT